MELERLLQGVRRVALGGHVRPDGDCVGSTLGLYQYLQKNYPEITVDVYLEPVPDSFRFIRCGSRYPFGSHRDRNL